MSDLDDRFAHAEDVADAVLYEGYVLYPYYAGSKKNQVRFQWGVVCPPGAPEEGAGESASMQTECLVEDAGSARLHVAVRFLQLQARSVEEREDGTFREVDELVVGDESWVDWDEAVEQVVEIPNLPVDELCADARQRPVRLPGGRDVEELTDDEGQVVGRLVRRRWPLEGILSLDATRLEEAGGVLRVTVRLDNTAAWTSGAGRPVALQRSFIAAHTLLGVDDGAFLSLADPPEGLEEAAEECENERTWPVLVGEPGQRDTILSSPIILEDYPEIAPESPGPMFDATEIDEILTLRVQTLTEEEKRRARATDERAAEIIEQADHLPDEIMERLHGVVRDFRVVGPPGGSAGGGDRGGGVRGGDGGAMGAQEVPVWRRPSAEAEPTEGQEEATPWWDPGADASVSPDEDTLEIDGVDVGRGSPVILHPKRRADAHDIFLEGQEATVTAVFFDVDGDSHLAVTVDEDPGGDLFDEFGRYYYFRPDEVTPVVDEEDPGEGGDDA